MDEPEKSSWMRAVDRVIRGDRLDRFVRLCPVPPVLRQVGLGPADVVMSAGKIARARKDHLEVPLAVWYALPELLRTPGSAFPSARRDGSIVVATIAIDTQGDPIIVPIQWDAGLNHNVVLSIYGRSASERMTGMEWIETQIGYALADGLPVFREKGFTDTEPKPDPISSEITSWSPGTIPADRSVKPRRQILTLRKIVNIEDNP